MLEFVSCLMLLLHPGVCVELPLVVWVHGHGLVAGLGHDLRLGRCRGRTEALAVQLHHVAPQHDPEAEQEAGHNGEDDGNEQVHEEGKEGPAYEDSDHDDDNDKIRNDPGKEEGAACEHGAEYEGEGGEEVKGADQHQAGQHELVVGVQPVQPLPHPLP